MARAKKEAAEAASEAVREESPANESPLVRMRMGDACIDVHPACVADHERLGWARA